MARVGTLHTDELVTLALLGGDIRGLTSGELKRLKRASHRDKRLASRIDNELQRREAIKKARARTS